MRQGTVRLGPLALLLTVVVICVTVLGLLALTTAQGDLAIAQRYAESVEARYALEAQGQAFLQQAAEDPRLLLALDRDEDGLRWKTFTQDGMSLHIALELEADSFRVASWRFTRDDWEPEEELGGLWAGE